MFSHRRHLFLLEHKGCHAPRVGSDIQSIGHDTYNMSSIIIIMHITWVALPRIFVISHTCIEWIFTLKLFECQAVPGLEQDRYLKSKWLQRKSNLHHLIRKLMYNHWPVWWNGWVFGDKLSGLTSNPVAVDKMYFVLK